MSASDVLIIGAGISGLLCATELQRSGLNVRIVEKGRGFGGRMSTRRMAGGRLDHGAQFFTVRDKRFQAYVDGWLGAGIIREWFRHSPHDSNPNGYPRYCGVKGMTDVPKHLAASLQVERSEQINELSRETDAWVARSESGALYRADYLVVTAPAPLYLPCGAKRAVRPPRVRLVAAVWAAETRSDGGRGRRRCRRRDREPSRHRWRRLYRRHRDRLGNQPPACRPQRPDHPVHRRDRRAQRHVRRYDRAEGAGGRRCHPVRFRFGRTALLGAAAAIRPA